MRIEMHVHGRDDVFVIVVLNRMQFFLQVARVVIEGNRQRAENHGSGNRALVLNERIAHEVAHDFAAVFRQTALCNQTVEANQQVLGHCHREPHQIVAHC